MSEELTPLHRLEEKLLKSLGKIDEVAIEEVASDAEVTLDQARRAVEWLKAKRFIEVETATHTQISLGSEGIKAAEYGLPERRLINILKEKEKIRIKELRRVYNGSEKELNVALGQARAKGWVKISGGREPDVQLLLLPELTPEEGLIRRLLKGPVEVESLSAEEKETYSHLLKRPGYLIEKSVKVSRLRLTSMGREALKSLVEGLELDALTPELIVTGRWREHRLRPLDVEAPAPPIYPGKKHPVQRFIDEVREIFVSLGFEEIEGPIVQPCFWNFDALFIPQDHPAREMQDTFYIQNLKAKRIEDEDIVSNVAHVHEDGWTTGSRGWRYRWSLDESKRLVLRTHTTAVTVKYLADHRPSEARVFSVGRVFRNEKVTYKNIVEFYQIEGIVVGSRVTLRDMMGLLSNFYSRLGLEKVKFWPSFFPYTEPSLQSVVYHDKLDKWLELCGMGIFRPEVTLPMGVKNPVLAWGGGLERLVMLRYDIDDIRRLYSNDLGWLRKIPLCQ